MSERTCVYRIYDNANRLLYVGATTMPFGRLEPHKATTTWFYQASHIELAWFDTLQMAREAEYHAIRDERPFYNIQYNVVGRWHGRYKAPLKAPEADEKTKAARKAYVPSPPYAPRRRRKYLS